MKTCIPSGTRPKARACSAIIKCEVLAVLAAFVYSRFAFFASFHLFTSRSAANTNGRPALANNGVYTAYLCSVGKYNNASMPGFENAFEARLKD